MNSKSDVHYFLFSGMEITEAQRKQAVHNARKTKQGNMKSMYLSLILV